MHRAGAKALSPSSPFARPLVRATSTPAPIVAAAARCPIHGTRPFSSRPSGMSRPTCRPALQAPRSACAKRSRTSGSERLTEEEVRALLPRMEDLGLQEGDHVTVGMSGGVDSATTLRLLQEFPIELDVIFMRNWDPLLSETSAYDSDSDSSSGSGSTSRNPISFAYPSTAPSPGKQPNLSPCQWERDWHDVRRSAAHCGIPEDKVRMVDLSREYWSRVFEPAVGVWERGGTPNPDVDCNREIKFGALLDVLPKGERHFLATGHYGHVDHSTQPPRLMRAADPSKDQTYYLSQMTEYQLSRTVLPLGRLRKTDVRRLAQYWELPTANKEESMGVCFIGERGKFGDFISQYTSPPSTPGYLTNLAGERLAPHYGTWYYTIGQRAKVASQRQALFVAKKGVGESGQDILVVPGHDHPMLRCDSVSSEQFFWIHGVPNKILGDGDRGGPVQVQVRHRMKPVAARVRINGPDSRNVAIDFDEPLAGVSPGQVAGVWLDGWCLGSGVIAGTQCPTDV